MRTDTISLGDEVRFATDVVAIDNNAASEQGYHPDYMRTQSPRGRKLRIQVLMNKHGFIELNLSNLDLRAVPAETFNFTRIEVLRLAKNRLSTISSAISHLRRLRVLEAPTNVIQVLPDTISNCSHLQELDLSHNRLSSLPQHFNSLRHLRILKLGHNKFENIQHELGDLESLRQLDLPGNKLWHLPTSLANLQNLRLINLGQNLFEQLPVCLCQARALEAIDLRGNRLINLPAECEKWRQLKELNVSSNRLETVPHCISSMINLHSLDLSHNKLKSLPARLTKLPKLRVLMACGNHITNIPNNFEIVEYLNLTDNRLVNFSVSKMRRLKYLNASHNALENLPLGVCNLPFLEVLKVSTNRISYMSQDIILLKHLKTLDMGNNKLTSLPHVINELDNLETFNVQGNKIDTRQHAPGIRTAPFVQQVNGFPAHQIRQQHSREAPPGADQGNLVLANGTHPLYGKKPHKAHDSTGNPGKKAGSTPLMPHSRTIATQYTPKSSVKMRERPPLDYQPKTNSLPSYPHSRLGHNNPDHSLTEGASFHNTIPRSSVPRDMTEIAYPMESMVEKSVHARSVAEKLYAEKSSGQKSLLDKSLGDHFERNTIRSKLPSTIIDDATTSYTRRWLEGRRRVADNTSVRSNAATVNGSVGDELSLGDEDYEFQPTTVRDQRLLGVCEQVEAMLNKQMLHPFVTPKSIFRKSLNEYGTMRTLNGLRDPKYRMYEVNPGPANTRGLKHNGAIHVTENVFLQRPLEAGNPNILLRTKADQFDVTPAGGLFKSSVDPNISVYFPVKAIPEPLTITMQLEKVDQEALIQAKRNDPIINNILAMGHVVHVTQSHDMDFQEQVTLTIPAPPAPKRGKLHILTYHEDNTCSPCTSPYKVYQGYISLQAWHFSGKGAVLTGSRCRYKACKSVEQLLSHLYI